LLKKVNGDVGRVEQSLWEARPTQCLNNVKGIFDEKPDTRIEQNLLEYLRSVARKGVPSIPVVNLTMGFGSNGGPEEGMQRETGVKQVHKSHSPMKERRDEADRFAPEGLREDGGCAEPLISIRPWVSGAWYLDIRSHLLGLEGLNRGKEVVEGEIEERKTCWNLEDDLTVPNVRIPEGRNLKGAHLLADSVHDPGNSSSLLFDLQRARETAQPRSPVPPSLKTELKASDNFPGPSNFQRQVQGRPGLSEPEAGADMWEPNSTVDLFPRIADEELKERATQLGSSSADRTASWAEAVTSCRWWEIPVPLGLAPEGGRVAISLREAWLARTLGVPEPVNKSWQVLEVGRGPGGFAHAWTGLGGKAVVHEPAFESSSIAGKHEKKPNLLTIESGGPDGSENQGYQLVGQILAEGAAHLVLEGPEQHPTECIVEILSQLKGIRKTVPEEEGVTEPDADAASDLEQEASPFSAADMNSWQGPRVTCWEHHPFSGERCRPQPDILVIAARDTPKASSFPPNGEARTNPTQHAGKDLCEPESAGEITEQQGTDEVAEPDARPKNHDATLCKDCRVAFLWWEQTFWCACQHGPLHYRCWQRHVFFIHGGVDPRPTPGGEELDRTRPNKKKRKGGPRSLPTEKRK